MRSEVKAASKLDGEVAVDVIGFMGQAEDLYLEMR